MQFTRRAALVLVLILALVSLSGCLVRRRIITRKNGGKKPLITTNKDVLVQRMQALYEPVKSFSATIDLVPSVGSVNKGEITEYKDVAGYILVQKPDKIRVIGLYPVVHNTAFDMVSEGENFQVYLPSKNRFVTGKNDAPTISENKLENLRPQAFLRAVLIPPPDPKEFVILYDDTDESNALYQLLLIALDPKGSPYLQRSISFDRETLRIVRQREFEIGGATISDTRYSHWKGFSNIPFPSQIDINRPKDGYGVVITIEKMDMNPQLATEKFVLKQPAGTQLQVLGTAPGVSQSAPPDVPPNIWLNAQQGWGWVDGKYPALKDLVAVPVNP